jgi:hypothetical protein
MNPKLLVLPAFSIAGAALLLAPARPSAAFAKLGGLLNENQRDVRVFDNFADASANNNVTPDSQFPGWVGVELAVWKGAVEWSSRPHGTGAGDPLNGNVLGDGGANFDPLWVGAAVGIGNSNTNIVSAIDTCGGGGTLAYTETPISDGWRIRFCDEWTWDDGPGTISNRWDIQGIMTHEYGHAIGLGHSGVGGATMWPSVGAGQTGIRSISADDITGVQCVYGLSSVAKPTIVATDATGGTEITIYGTNFSLTGNEVWFTNEDVTPAVGDPIVRVTDVASNGTRITVPIPASASPGDVMVKKVGSGGSSLTNPFPTDLVGVFGEPPTIQPVLTSIFPTSVDALIPGTEQTVVLSGSDFVLVTDVLLDGTPIDPARYTIVGNDTITLDMPQVATLGEHQIGVTDGAHTEALSVTVVTPILPRLQWGTGELDNVVDRDDGFTILLSGDVGDNHYLYYSFSSSPSSNAFVSFDIGASFTDLTRLGVFTIPTSGVASTFIPPSAIGDPGPGGLTVYAESLAFQPPAPFPDSNTQSIHIVQ